MNKQELSQEALIADMKSAFPGLLARTGAEFGKDYSGAVWTGGEACMPDGMRILSYMNESEEYDGGVHEGFTAWLENRGWYLECYDGETYLAYPVSIFEPYLEYEKAKAAWSIENPMATPEEYTAAMRRIADACGV